ncbi:hypothetical protein JHK82_047750 [Glycine max]|uniref:HMA domain-containing protein n=3 Tax=Glycine subgen. Soja TaxID=1462606 RepID=K7MM19_SOYBN|nr:hypothetical protein JHK86_047637 [Glycine max]KAG4933443.1 hypothetical protein JHK87_047445 [Glycine soja]KAG4943607.1 hypothetical protein JHK85_048253 [Glycine max]KAG5097896.1 hypothetical protein JHK82_047750 [Glycine max]KAG5102694.1 hypothetical protein JHK84_047663 [Glycine max]
MVMTINIDCNACYRKVKRALLNMLDGEAATEEVKKSNHVLRKLEKQKQNQVLDPHIEEKFGGGRLLACISSRPGQCGCADRDILGACFSASNESKFYHCFS